LEPVQLAEEGAPVTRLHEIKVLFWLVALLVGLALIAYEANRPPNRYEVQLQCLHEWVENEKVHGPRFGFDNCLRFYGVRP